MPRSEKKRATDAKWKKANRASITCTMYKNDVEAFKAYAASQGKSVNELLREYVAACLGRPLERRADTAGGQADEEQQRPPE